MSAGSDSLAGGCSPRVERGGQEALADVLDHPSAKDAEKLMETVVKASRTAQLSCLCNMEGICIIFDYIIKELPPVECMGCAKVAAT